MSIVKGLLQVSGLKRIIRYLLKKRLGNSPLWGGSSFETELEKNLKIFLSQEEINNKHLINKLSADIFDCYFLYDVLPQEYFLFGFRDNNKKIRGKFLANAYKDKRLLHYCPYAKYKEDLRDKFKFYVRFKQFFKRDVCRIAEKKDFDDFKLIAEKHNGLFVKPLSGMCGVGAKIIRYSQSNLEDVFNSLLSEYEGGCIVEEIIKQNIEMAKWNESSVNTIRIPSFFVNGVFTIFKPFVRFGRKGSVVDNAASNGIACLLDEKTGAIISLGRDEHGVYYKAHPDSGLSFKGFQVPEWSKLLELAEEAHRMMPDHRYIGWDFAYSNYGWCLIEGDWGQFLSELIDQEGIKDKFDKLIEGETDE